MKLKTDRMETLADSILAIVMTVMLVSLAEIFSFKNPLKNEDFHLLFLSLSNNFISYALSFLILGVLWFEHHWQFHYIKYIDPVLVLINVLWFMFICLIPFATMLVGNHPNFFPPVIALQINILIVFLLLYAHWLYATYKKGMVEPDLDKKIISGHRKFGVLTIIVILSIIAMTCLYHFSKVDKAI